MAKLKIMTFTNPPARPHPLSPLRKADHYPRRIHVSAAYPKQAFAPWMGVQMGLL
jgi:hypothetical protein